MIYSSCLDDDDEDGGVVLVFVFAARDKRYNATAVGTCYHYSTVAFTAGGLAVTIAAAAAAAAAVVVRVSILYSEGEFVEARCGNSNCVVVVCCCCCCCYCLYT